MRRGAAALLGVALMVILAILGWRGLRYPPVQAVLLEAAPVGEWGHLPEEERLGLLALLQEALELDPRVTLLTEPPRESRAGLRRFLVSAREEGGTLLLRFRAEDATPFETAGPPRKAIADMFGELGFEHRRLGALLPEEPGVFWQLARISGPFTYAQLQPRRDLALALARADSGSASAWFRAAYLHARLLIREAAEDPDALTSCDHLFRRVLESIPDHPRALYHYARYKTDVGDPEGSLALAFRLLESHPRSLLPYGALAYAARCAGLLEGARRAIHARERLAGGLGGDPGLGENTYLYLGDLDRFEKSLAAEPGTPFSPLRLFYRGYLELLRGHPERALGPFREAQSRPGRTIQFERLARVYELALLEKREEALAELREIVRERTQIRVPDGEFTFKLAEAFGFLGADSEALETGLRASAQGFGCRAWYEGAPFLRSVQAHPRWQALLRHLQEQEARLNARFPPAGFGPG
ncbi:MAG: hypothetical protein HY823_08095 [Acidobacteria bacterium]|nr:hypothetical protein [Acidobacteriota bacterium]